MSKSARAGLGEGAAQAGYIATELETRGAAFLRSCEIPFHGFFYHEELNVTSPTQQSTNSTVAVPKTRALTDRLGVSENSVVKTLVFYNSVTKEPFIILMHGDCLVNTKKLAKAIGAPRVSSCPIEVAQEHSGYQVGGTSPFGLANVMPVYIESSILDLDSIIINGGSKQAYLLLDPKDITNAFDSAYARGLGYPALRTVECKQLRKPDNNGEPPIPPPSAQNQGDKPTATPVGISASISASSVERRVSGSHRHLDSRVKQLQEVDALRLMYPLNNLEEAHDVNDLDVKFDSVYTVNTIRQLVDEKPVDYATVSSTSHDYDQRLIKEGEITVSFPIAYPVDDTETQMIRLHVAMPVGYPHEPARASVTLESEWSSIDIAGLSSALNRYTQKLALTQSAAVFAARSYVFDNAAKFSLKPKPVEDINPADDVHQSLLGKILNRMPPHDSFIQPSTPAVRVNIEAGEPISLLGKPKGHIKIGLVGLPNVGKSSLFNLVSGMQVPAENYAFCTIDPNVASVPIIDTRYNTLLKSYKPTKHQPAVVSVVDIAGLVKGASKGLGLGNAFLHHISTVQVIYQVIRVFPDKHVEHVEGTVDPIRDINIINRELVEKDLEQMHKRIGRLNRPRMNQWAPTVSMKENHELEILLKAHEWLLTGQPLRLCKWNPAETAFLSTLQMWTSKPVCYLLNMSAVQYSVPKLREEAIAPVKAWLDLNAADCALVPISVSYEQAARKCPEDAEPWFIAAVAVRLNEFNTRNDADADVDAHAVDVDADKKKKHSSDKEGKKEKKEKKSSKKDDSKDLQKSVKPADKKDKKEKKAFAEDFVDFSGGFASFLDDPIVPPTIATSVTTKVDMTKVNAPEVVFPSERDARSRSNSANKQPSSRENSEIRKMRLPAEFLVKLEDPEVNAQVQQCAFGIAKSRDDDSLIVDKDDEPVSKAKNEDPEAHTEVAARRCKSLTLSENSALMSMIKVGYSMARLKQFYICYPQLVKGIMIPNGCKAPGAAARVNYELEEGFVSCEVCNYEDWLKAGRSMNDARDTGSVKTQGKNYEVMDGDIMMFKGVNKAKLFQ